MQILSSQPDKHLLFYHEPADLKIPTYSKMTIEFIIKQYSRPVSGCSPDCNASEFGAILIAAFPLFCYNDRIMSSTGARILLISVFIARGTSFLFSKTLMQDLPPMSILAVRFLLAFLILAVIFHKKLLHFDRNSFRGGVILGVLYTLCMIFEMFGLRQVDTGVSSLVENMAIIMVPVFTAVLTRTVPKKMTMFCALLAVAGVGFLSLTQRSTGSSHGGMILTILAAVTYAVCIMATEKVSRNADPVTIGILQLGTMGLLSLIASLTAGDPGMPQTGRQWLFMLLLVLVCSCFGFAFQPLGQKYVSAEEAAVLTVVNPLTASLMGILIAGELLSPMKSIGYVLILTALFLYQWSVRRHS